MGLWDVGGSDRRGLHGRPISGTTPAPEARRVARRGLRSGSQAGLGKECCYARRPSECQYGAVLCVMISSLGGQLYNQLHLSCITFFLSSFPLLVCLCYDSYWELNQAHSYSILHQN